MIGLFGGLFGGFLGGSVLSGSFPKLRLPVYDWSRGIREASGGGLYSTNLSKDRYYKIFMDDYKVSDEMFTFIRIWEALIPKAKKLGDGKVTVGFGSTMWRDDNGKVIRAVVEGDTITEMEAEKQMRLYYNSVGTGVKATVDSFIKRNGLKIHQRLYDMYLQITYMSGSYHSKEGYNVLRELSRETNLTRIANVLSKSHINYLKKISTYGQFGLGWSRRTYAVQNYIIGNELWKNKARVEQIIKTRY